MTLNLAELEPPLEPVTFRDGSSHDVVPLDGVAAQMAMNLPDSGPERIDGYRQIVARCIPDATPEQLQLLTVVELDFLIAHASRQQEKVAEYLGKAVTEDAASSSTTPSATRSRASRRPSGS